MMKMEKISKEAESGNSDKFPKNYFSEEIFILKCLGIDLFKKETLLYSISSKIYLFWICWLNRFLEGYELYLQWGDLNAVVGILNYVITCLMGALQAGIVFVNRKDIGKMMMALHLPPFAPDEKRGGSEERRLILVAYRRTRLIFKGYFSVIYGSILSGTLNSYFIRFTKPKDQWKFPFIETMSVGDWIMTSPYIELAIWYQFAYNICLANMIACNYTLLASIMAHISVQMKILGNAFRNLRQRAEILAGPLKDDPQIVHIHMEVLMRSSIKHHLDCLEMAGKMESLCNLVFLTIFLFSVILLCCLLYFASLLELGSVPFFQYICYVCTIIFQVYMYCFWGNEVSLESEKVAIAAAEMDWPGAPRSIVHAVGMVIQRAQKPVYITAGKFVPLSMEVFMAIIRGSFSYFMILRQTQNPELYTS